MLTGESSPMLEVCERKPAVRAGPSARCLRQRAADRSVEDRLKRSQAAGTVVRTLSAADPCMSVVVSWCGERPRTIYRKGRVCHMQASRVTVLSYGSGNVRSAVRALERVGAQVTLTSDPHEVTEADGLVVPGVGAFGAVMDQLRAVDAPRLIEQRLAGGRPVLGICVGMQVMFERSEEHGPRRRAWASGPEP